MSIQKSMKWLALVGVGFLVSGCVAAQPQYAPGDVNYSDTPPGTFVEDASYPGGGYYEVVEVYEDPSYYGPAYYGPSFGTTLFFGSSNRFRDRDRRFSRSERRNVRADRRDVRADRRDARADRRDVAQAGTPEERQALRNERRTARADRRATRRSQCQSAGHQNCRGAIKSTKTSRSATAKGNRKIRPASSRTRRKR